MPLAEAVGSGRLRTGCALYVTEGVPMNKHDLHMMFTARYDADNIPWDTGITPPEIVAVVEELPPGRALDLGCGTGTNVRYLVAHGWQADGVDFVQKAIDQAQTKLADLPTEAWGAYCHDVTQLPTLDTLRAPYDLVVDIGCGHAVPLEATAQYAIDVASLMQPNAIMMVYAHFPDEGRPVGWTDADVKRIFSAHFSLTWQQLSTDTTNGSPSGWYRLEKR